MFGEGALKIGQNVETVTNRMIMRTVHAKTRDDENQISTLDSAFKRQWDVEFLQPTIEYPDYDNFVHKPEEKAWKCIFTFDFEKQTLDDFKPQVNVKLRTSLRILSVIQCIMTKINFVTWFPLFRGTTLLNIRFLSKNKV